MKIALVHDYFTQIGGAEQVAMQLFRLLPDPDLFAAVALPNRMPEGLKDAPVKTSWMQKLPGMERNYRHYFLLYPLGVESLDLSEYDLVISSSSGYGKGVRARRDAVHVCYCHNPMRWAWSFAQYSEREQMGSAKRAMLSVLSAALRKWDLGASREPDHFIANSKTVADRILQAYGRHAEVIHPPIDVDRFRPSKSGTDDYYLVLSRLISYKRIDLAIEACNRLGRELLIIGDGPDRERLVSMAGPTIQFAGRLPDHRVEFHAARCRAVLFPGEEDFGMVPLEVAAAGRPAVAYYGGGARETVEEGTTGVFFREPTAESLMTAIERLESQEWSSRVLRKHAEKFSVPAFQAQFRAFMERVGVSVPEPADQLATLVPQVQDFSWTVAEDIA
ncbi:MAG TPA: glycosyltransferase [Acidobacteriaceae bacterium]|jgi:glycosyltransferase involved in cell wall biosynthesis|nr:glycosyltransferase [Acidobacteriaceae bacterium]